MRKIFMVVTVFLLVAVNSFAGVTLPPTEKVDNRTGIKSVTWSWESNVSGIALASGGYHVSGVLVGVRFVPGVTSGVSVNYDVQLLDENSVDVLMGTGADRWDTASGTTNYRTPETSDGDHLVPLLHEALTLSVTNASSGVTADGSVTIFLK